MRYYSVAFLLCFMLLLFSSTVSKADLLAHWKLDGNAKDGVGGYDGTPQGGAEFKENGKNGGAVALGGNGDYIQTDLMEELQTAESFTLAAWFQTNDTANGMQHMIWVGDVSANGWGDQEEVHLGINHFNYFNKLVFYYGAGVDSDGHCINIVTKADFTDTSDWHHLAGVIENADGPVVSGKLYLDGELMEPLVDDFKNISKNIAFPTMDTTENPPTRGAWNSGLRIGAPGSAQRYFNGMIDDVMVWDEALGQEDLARSGGFAVEPAGKLATIWGAIRR